MNLKQWIEEVRGRCERASEGPWINRGDFISRKTLLEGAENSDGFFVGYAQGEKKFENAEFIAHAREDLPKALSVIEGLAKALEFYADPKNFDHRTMSTQPTYEFGTIEVFWNALTKDRGKRAREALEQDLEEAVKE